MNSIGCLSLKIGTFVFVALLSNSAAALSYCSTVKSQTTTLEAGCVEGWHEAFQLGEALRQSACAVDKEHCGLYYTVLGVTIDDRLEPSSDAFQEALDELKLAAEFLNKEGQKALTAIESMRNIESEIRRFRNSKEVKKSSAKSSLSFFQDRFFADNPSPSPAHRALDRMQQIEFAALEPQVRPIWKNLICSYNKLNALNKGLNQNLVELEVLQTQIEMKPHLAEKTTLSMMQKLEEIDDKYFALIRF